ncbi:hypothetical protein P4641_03615 [Halalkalibacterium halodurans]|uniref:hypothetical protein n=1 Tax=Halalkalibacterium halodurans TaxID=86665 RepID=UPI002E1CD721|nr:hypothetical protein [Halalkalibacterium halodurans]
MKTIFVLIISYIVLTIAVYLRLRDLGIKKKLLSRTFLFPIRVTLIHFDIASRSKWSTLKKVRFILRPILNLPSVIVAYGLHNLKIDIFVDALNEILQEKNTDDEKQKVLEKLVAKGILKKVEKTSEVADPKNFDVDYSSVYRKPELAMD